MNPFWEPSLNISIRRDSYSDQAEGPDASKRSGYLGRSLGPRQLWLTGLIMAIGFLALAGRALSLQVMNGATYRGMAEGNRVRVRTISAPRGLFYDRFGRQLAENTPALLLAFRPHDLPRQAGERDRIINEVSAAVGVSKEKLGEIWDDLIKSKGSIVDPIAVVNNLPLADGPRLTVLTNGWPGVEIVSNPLRYYPVIGEGTTSLSHLFGYVGLVAEDDLAKSGQRYSFSDIIGKNGLELFFENILRGENGQREAEIDALGQEQQVLTETAPKSGRNIWLTLDLDLQKIVGNALQAGLHEAGARRGAVIVMDPRDGSILSMVSYPSYDANRFNRGLNSADYQALINNPDNPLFNRAIQGLYPAGSSIKPVMAAAALSEGVITGSTKYLSTGGFSVGPSFFPDWKAGGHGWTDVRRALAESINTFFYIVGGGYNGAPGLGIARIEKYASLFGLGEKTGVDLPNEAVGLVPSPEWKMQIKKTSWYIGDTYHVSIGQGDLLVTPLQVANFTSAIANNGVLYQPHFLLEIFGADESHERFTPAIIRQGMVSPENLKIVREGMRQAVTSGSARSLSSLPIEVAGKTGTAQAGGHKPFAWFIGFAPYHAPQIAVTIVLENAGEGSTYAVPIAKEILQWWAENRGDN